MMDTSISLGYLIEVSDFRLTQSNKVMIMSFEAGPERKAVTRQKQTSTCSYNNNF